MSIDTSNTTTSSVLDQYAIKSQGSDVTKTQDLGKDQFLKLLVAQMNNQNPLEPQGNGEFIAQLAQFSTVEGITNLNTSVNSIMTGAQSTQALQASSLVGRTVILDTNTAMVDTSKTATEPFKGGINLTQSSDNVWVDVYDTSGQQVSRINLGQQSSGLVSFSWDGTDANGGALPPGTYKFEAQANVGGEKVAFATSLPANVESVTLGQNGGEMLLNLTGKGSIALSKVQVVGQ